MTQYADGMASSSAFTFRNKIINGGMEVWQRGTSGAVVAGTPTYIAADRWYGNSGGAAMTFSRGGSLGTYQLFCNRTPASALTNRILVGQIIESLNAVELAGKTVTVSAKLQAGANFSATSSIVTIRLRTGTGTDQGAAGAEASTWTTFAEQTSDKTITTTEATYSATFTIPSGTTEVGVAFSFAPTGTAGAADYFAIRDIQLEEGSVATPFETRPVGIELALCQRYLPAYNAPSGSNSDIAVGQAGSATAAYIPFTFVVTPRVPPTGVTVSNVAHFGCTNAGYSATNATSVISIGAGATLHAALLSVTSSGLLAGDATWFRSTNASAQLLFTGCEL